MMWRPCGDEPGCPGPASGTGDRGGDDLAGLVLDGRQVLGTAEGLGVQLVDVLGAGGAGSEPARRGDDLEPADRGTVARRGGQRRGDLLPGQLVRGDLIRGQLAE